MKYIKYMLFGLAFIGGAALASEPMKIGVDPNLKPFVYQDATGEIKGFDVDIAKALCKQIDRECVFVPMEWDALIPSLNARKIDAIVSSMSITGEREKVVDFTRPYYKSPSQLLVKDAFEGLYPGDRIGVLRGSTDEAYANANEAFKSMGIKIVSYGNQNEAFLDLEVGRLIGVLGPSIELQAGLIDTPDGAGYMLFGPLLTNPKFYGPGIGIALRETDRPLTESLNAAINHIHETGEWQAISNEYFNFDIWVH